MWWDDGFFLISFTPSSCRSSNIRHAIDICKFYLYLDKKLTIMGKLIALTAYSFDATQYASASPMTIQADSITITENASLKQKQSNPAASGSINTAVYANYPSENEGQSHVILISETQATLVTNS